MSMNITLEVDGLQDCIDMVRPFTSPEVINEKTEQVMTPTIEEMTGRLRERAPYKTGTYRRSIMWERDATGWTAGTESQLGPWLEFGTGIRGEFPTKIYEIRPKYKKALRWKRELTPLEVFLGLRGRLGVQHKELSWGSKSSKTHSDVFAQVVRHPGMKSSPHFRPTLEEYTPIFHDRLSAMFASLIDAGGAS